MIKRVVTSVSGLLVAFLLIGHAYGADITKSRIILRLRPSAAPPGVITKGNSGRADFDRVVQRVRIESVNQLLSPDHTPAKGRDFARQLRLHDYVMVQVPVGADPDAVRAALLRSPDVELVEFDPIVRAFGASISPNDLYFGTYQYALRNTGTQPPFDPGIDDADIDMDDGWQYTTGDTATVLAILDSGIDFLHPEFDGRIWLNPDEEFDELDNDGNGLIDDFSGWNFSADNNSPSDGLGHGTHVAGIAAATGNNANGIAGMNWNCRIMPLKVLSDEGSGFGSWVAAGIVYAANKGADVISMSLGGPAGDTAQENAIRYAESLGVVIVAAMGNNNVGAPQWPAAYDGVISVGATDSDDRRASPFCSGPGSNYGAWIDVCAPGDNVWSTYLSTSGSYTNLCGTSMATPHVSGLISLMVPLRPAWPADSILNILRHTSEDQVGRVTEDTPGFDIYHGWGRINADHALRALSIDYPPVITVPDSVETTEAETLSVLVTALDSNFSSLTYTASSIPNGTFVDNGDGTMTYVFMPDYSQAGEYPVEFTVSDGSTTDTAVTLITVANGCQCPCAADPACDAVTDISDVVGTINVAFRGGAQTTDSDCFPNAGGRTDVNCSGATDVLDVVDMIDVAFRGQPVSFCNPCDL